MRKRFSGTTGMVLTFAIGVVVAMAATAGAASLITGKQIKDGSISAKDLSKAVRAELGKTGLPGPKGDTGPQGPAGKDGAAGKDGTDATVDGVAAGGALDGSFPNPTLKAGAVGVNTLSSDLQQSFQLQDNDPANAPLFIDGPTVAGVTIRLSCTPFYELLQLTNATGSAGSYAISYIRGTGTAVHNQAFLDSNSMTTVLTTAAPPERGSGQLLFWPTSGGVWALDFNYDLTASYCSTQGVMRHA